jgi:hypothetical protein
MKPMKLKDSGKEHQAGNPRCAACDQQGPDGGRLIPSVKHFPYADNPPCGGLVHSEVFGDDSTGWEILYRCDKCGSFH